MLLLLRVRRGVEEGSSAEQCVLRLEPEVWGGVVVAHRATLVGGVWEEAGAGQCEGSPTVCSQCAQASRFKLLHTPRSHQASARAPVAVPSHPQLRAGSIT